MHEQAALEDTHTCQSLPDEALMGIEMRHKEEVLPCESGEALTQGVLLISHYSSFKTPCLWGLLFSF